SGVVALILQTAPGAPPAQIKSLLARGARVDAFTGAVWNRDWGNGKLFMDQTTAALVSLFQASASAFAIELRWRMGDPAAFAAVTLERAASPDGPWARVPAERRIEGDLTVATDRGVVAGALYYYRLVADAAAGERLTFGPLAVTAGVATTTLGLDPVTPN